MFYYFCTDNPAAREKCSKASQAFSLKTLRKQTQKEKFREKIRTTILSMKTGSSPGMDGFPVEYYRKYVDILAPVLLKHLKQPDSFNNALITLIPQKDRASSQPSH